jgi:hypothetical protein
MKPMAERDTSTLGAFAASAGEAIAATPAALAGARGAMALTPPVLPVVGPFAKPIAGIAGGVAGGILGSMGVTSLEGAIDDVFGTDILGTREQQRRESPGASLAGQVAGGSLSPFMRPGMPSTVKEGLFGAGVMSGIGAGQRAVSGEDILDPKMMAIDAASGAFTKPTKLGERILGIPSTPKGAPDVTSSTDLPPKPTPKSTPEERAVYIDSLKKRLAEKNATVPVVEAAFRNKETGEVQRVGKAHDEQQKIELADTHEQGFVDERGNFLTRKEAWNRTKSAGQIPEGQTPVEPQTGLRSQDLRNAGDERFTVPELTATETPVDTTVSEQKPYDPNQLVTRDDYRTAISEKENKALTSELLAEEALARGNEAEAARHNQRAAELQQELDQLRTDMPAVEFADPKKPTWEETQDYLYGVKTVGEAFDRLSGLKDLNKIEKLLIKALNQSEFIRNAKLDMQSSWLEYTDSNGEIKPAAGLYWGGADHRVQIGALGDVRVLLHEAMHAGTQRLLDVGNTRAAKELNRLYEQFTTTQKAKYQEALDAALKEKGSLTPREYAALEDKYLHYGMTNVHEFVAEAFSSKEFQSMLKEIKTGERQKGTNSIWGKFVEAVREGLNIPEGARTALDDVLEQGVSLVKKSKDFTKESSSNFATAAPSKASDKFIQDQEEVFWNKVQAVRDAKTIAQEAANKAFELYKENPNGKTKLDYTKAQKNEEAAVSEYNKYVPENELDRLDFLERESAFKKSKEALNKASTSPLPSKSVKEMMREEGSKPDPRDMKDEDDFYKTAVDIYEKSGDKAAIEFYEGYKEYKKTWLEPVAETEKFVGTNLRNKLAGERVTSNNKAEILDIANKDGVNLEQLTYKIDRGDKLDGAEKTIADKFRTFMDNLGKRALKAGVIRGWHEDYVARNVVSEGDVPKGALEEFMRDIFGGGEGGTGGSKTTTKYGEPRRLKTREDLLRHLDGINGWLAENGKDYRFKLKTDNLAEIYADYAHAVEKAIENKNLITNLKQVRNAAGESLVRPITKDDPLPHGWEVIDNSELAGYAVHPDLLPALKFVFDAGPGQLMQALGTVSQITKRINVVGSFFHAKSLMEVLSSAQIPIWTPLKEAIVLPLVEKSVRAATGKELQLSAITKAVDQYRNGGVGDNVDKWIKEGRLQLDAPEDVARGILSSMGKFADTMIGKYGPKTRVLESSLSTVEKYTLGLFDKYTWDYLHTGGKLMVADAYLDRARLQAAKEGKPFDETAARIEISRFVNDSFGGLNWFDAAAGTQNEFAKRMAMAAYSPEGRRSLQIALFAPDWTISTLRAFTAALPKSLNPTKLSPVEGIKGMINPTTKSDYARLYQFKTALTYLTLINAINLMVANRPVWENKDPTRIEFPDGTSMQAMKHAMEPVHWIMDPDKTLSNKLGFIPKATMIGIAGTEYASPDAPKLVDRSALSRLKAAASGALPFQVSAAMSAPEGEGAKRALLGTMGFPVYGSTPEQRKLKAAERELQTKELAYKYRDKEIAAGREKMTPEHIKQGNMLRKRREEMDRKMGK